LPDAQAKVDGPYGGEKYTARPRRINIAEHPRRVVTQALRASGSGDA